MLFILPLVIGIFGLRTIDAAGKTYAHTWSYDKTSGIGPTNWYKNASDCAKNAQSPINIFTKDTKLNKDLKLELIDYSNTGPNVYLKMKNRNTDIAFEAAVEENTTPPVPQCVKFAGSTYRFYQFHFHWGAENFKGSEHVIDWQRYGAEMHIIHYNTKYADIGKAVAQPDGLLVWGHFLKVDSKAGVANQNFQALLDHFSKSLYCCNVTKVTGLNLKALLPVPYSDFYHYKGSLTTPPCYESVKWIVNRNPISVSEKQMETFRKFKDNAHNPDRPLQDNFRPAQPLNAREVQRNFEFDSASVPLKPSVAILAVLAVFMLAL